MCTHKHNISPPLCVYIVHVCIHEIYVHVHVCNIIVCMYTAEHMSDDEEASIPELPTISDNFMTPPTHRRMAPPSTLPTDLKSHPPPHTAAPSSSQQSNSNSSGSGGGDRTRLSVSSSDRPEATSPRTQRSKWASVTSNSFDLSGDEGSTPAVFGKAVLNKLLCQFNLSVTLYNIMDFMWHFLFEYNYIYMYVSIHEE